MQQDLVCRSCLAVDRKFSYVHEFSTAQAYESLVGIPMLPSDGFPQHICSFCFRTLHKFTQFKMRCLKALAVLHQAHMRGQVITKEYANSLTSSYAELKPLYVRSKTVTLDISNTDDVLKEEIRDDLLDFTGTQVNYDIEKEERLSDNEIDDGIADTAELKRESNEFELEFKTCKVFVDDYNASNKNVVKKVKKEVKKRQVKAKKVNVKKIKRKASKSDTEIVTAYAKSAGFDIAFLTHAEQLKEIDDRINDIVPNSHNCKQCGKICKDSNTLERHQKNYHVLSPASYMCDICSCVFKNKRTLKAHVAAHSWIFTCQSCNFKTKQRPVLRKHQYYHQGKMFKCKYCGKVFEKHASYFSHVRLKHATELAWCELCGEFFNSEKGVESHKKLTHNMVEEFPNVCRNCDRRFKSDAALERHGAVKGCEHASCAQCGDSFPAPSLLKYHLVQRHFAAAAPPWFPCGRCPLRFHNAGARLRHVCGAACTCAQCGDHFPHAQLLASHVQARHHIFKCEECGKQFTNAAYFKRHYTLSHTGRTRRPRGRQPAETDEQGKYKKHPKQSSVRKWRVVGEGELTMERADGAAGRAAAGRVVCELCGKYVKNKTELRYHQQAYHSGVSQYSCAHCAKGFKRKDLLKMHERVHTGERPYKCPECPKAFKTYQACTRHQLVHSGERKHVCSMCDKAFQLSTSVKWHIKTAHLNMPWPTRNRGGKRKVDNQYEVAPPIVPHKK